MKFFSKFFIKPDTTEHELKALDEITKFEKFNSSSFTNQPYAEAAYHNKEIALLNNYYKSKVKDRLALRYMFTRADNKRAFRLYSDTKTSIFLKQFGEVYVLRWWVSKWWVYPVAAVWLIFICMLQFHFYSVFIFASFSKLSIDWSVLLLLDSRTIFGCWLAYKPFNLATTSKNFC